MASFLEHWKEKKNFIFIGEAGCGKSEIALNLASLLAQQTGQNGITGVDLFDMDQTKPLFRSRDLADEMAARGVTLHYQDQYLDSPQAVGGVGPAMADPSRFTIIDAGGDKNGARLIGAYANWINRDDSIAFYVVNPYRPWSGDIYAIDATLTSILAVSHIMAFHMMANPNLGHDTSLADWQEGIQKAREILDPFTRIEALACGATYAAEIKEALPLLPIDFYIDYKL